MKNEHEKFLTVVMASCNETENSADFKAEKLWHYVHPYPSSMTKI